MSTHITEIDVLLAKQAIAELVCRIARGVDRRDPELIRSAFHEDGTDDHGAYRGPAAGFAEWATSFRWSAASTRSPTCSPRSTAIAPGPRATSPRSTTGRWTAR